MIARWRIWLAKHVLGVPYREELKPEPKPFLLTISHPAHSPGLIITLRTNSDGYVETFTRDEDDPDTRHLMNGDRFTCTYTYPPAD